MPMYSGSGKLRMAALVFSPSAVCASSQMTSWYASRSRSRTWRANQAYVWIVIGFLRLTRRPWVIASSKRSP
jgi:hypothetical protein